MQEEKNRRRLAPGNEIYTFCRGRQGRARVLAKMVGISDTLVSLTLRGIRGATPAEIASIEKAYARMRRAADREETSLRKQRKGQ